jgi:hypothetical protein
MEQEGVITASASAHSGCEPLSYDGQSLRAVARRRSTLGVECILSIAPCERLLSHIFPTHPSHCSLHRAFTSAHSCPAVRATLPASRKGHAVELHLLGRRLVTLCDAHGVALHGCGDVAVAATPASVFAERVESYNSRA